MPRSYTPGTGPGILFFVPHYKLQCAVRAKGVKFLDVMSKPGRTLSRDIARGELVEKELDVFISRQHDRRVTDEGERPAEAAWMESERRHDVGRREAMRAAWAEYHRGQAERHRTVLESLIDRHEAEVERLQATDERRTG